MSASGNSHVSPSRASNLLLQRCCQNQLLTSSCSGFSKAVLRKIELASGNWTKVILPSRTKSSKPATYRGSNLENDGVRFAVDGSSNCSLNVLVAS